MAKAIRSKWAVEFEDLKRLRKALKALEKDGPWKQDLKEAGERAAEIVAREARGRVPVKTGALRDFIKAKGLTTGGKVEFGGPKAPHGPVQEFGGEIFTRGRKSKWQAKPFKRSGYFIFPSLKDRRDEAAELYRKAVDEIVDKYFPGGV